MLIVSKANRVKRHGTKIRGFGQSGGRGRQNYPDNKTKFQRGTKFVLELLTDDTQHKKNAGSGCRVCLCLHVKGKM